MKASIKNNIITFDEISQAEIKHLKKVLSWSVKDEEEVDTLLSRNDDGQYETLAGLYYPLSDIFDIELLTPLEEPTIDGIEVREDIVDGKILRDYQLASIRKCIMHKKGIAELATGAGKTVLAIGMIKTLEEYNKISRSLIVVPSEPIMKQFHQAEINAGLIDTGIIYGGKKDYDKRHIVALADSINRGLKMQYSNIIDIVANADITIFDECFVGHQHVVTVNGPMSLERLYLLFSKMKSLPTVLSYNESNKRFEYKHVNKVFKIPASNRELITVSCGRKSFTCSLDHQFLTVTGWVEAQQLAKDDKIIGAGDKILVVTHLAKTARTNYLYDLEVEDNHTYIVCNRENSNGAVVHNCHHLASNKFASIALTSNSEYRIGLSGTPFKEDSTLEYVEDALVCGIAGRVISRVSQRWLVERGYIAEPIIFMKPIKGRFNKYKARYNTIYNREIVEKVIRNQYIIDYCGIFYQYGLSVLVIVNQKAHAIHLMSKLRKLNPNITSICVFGGSQAVKHDEYGCIDSYKVDFDKFADDFEHGAYNVAFATQVLEEGYDLPSVGAIIMVGGGKSRRQVRQRVGRGTRSKTSGRNVVFILDFIDRGHVYVYTQSLKRLNKIYIGDMEADVLETEEEFLEFLDSLDN